MKKTHKQTKNKQKQLGLWFETLYHIYLYIMLLHNSSLTERALFCFAHFYREVTQYSFSGNSRIIPESQAYVFYSLLCHLLQKSEVINIPSHLKTESHVKFLPVQSNPCQLVSGGTCVVIGGYSNSLDAGAFLIQHLCASNRTSPRPLCFLQVI